jgi:hypothetical protein
VVLRGHQLAEWRKLDEVAEGERVEQADGGIAGRLVCKNKEAFGGKGGQLWLWSSGISTFTHSPSPVEVLRKQWRSGAATSSWSIVQREGWNRRSRPQCARVSAEHRRHERHTGRKRT